MNEGAFAGDQLRDQNIGMRRQRSQHPKYFMRSWMSPPRTLYRFTRNQRADTGKLWIRHEQESTRLQLRKDASYLHCTGNSTYDGYFADLKIFCVAG
jgi:hypothetical protein